MELIDRKSLIEWARKNLDESDEVAVVMAADAQSTITERAAELKKELGGLYCSSCEYDIDELNDDFNYCPNCGAKFKEVQYG